MILGVPRETHRHEHRVGLTPSAVARLVERGHAVVVERGAGEAARFGDGDYERAGARVVYTAEEAYRRADVVCRVGALAPEELDLLAPRTTVCAFHHLAVAPRATLERLVALEATVVGYEVVRDAAGHLAVLVPFSEMAGRMAVHVAAHHLQVEAGGRGILLGNVPGVAPPTVLVVGAGTVGSAAAAQAVAVGAHTIVVDADLAKLRRLAHDERGRVVTALAVPDKLLRFTAVADVVVGAVLVPGGRTPYLVTEAMVRGMKPGSVVVDVAIDQGGCVATSRPTTLADPTFVVDGVVHYCVPNMTANVARTASRALANAALPRLEALADAGVAAALAADPGLAAGVYLHRGAVTNPHVAAALGVSATPIAEVLAGS